MNEQRLQICTEEKNRYTWHINPSLAKWPHNEQPNTRVSVFILFLTIKSNSGSNLNAKARANDKLKKNERDILDEKKKSLKKNIQTTSDFPAFIDELLVPNPCCTSHFREFKTSLMKH